MSAETDARVRAYRAEPPARPLPDPRLADLLAEHPVIDHPTYGCCVPPKVCTRPHGAVCAGDHDLGPPPWPCAALRGAGVVPR